MEDGRYAKFFAMPLIIATCINNIIIYDDEQDDKEAALGGPSSDETFPLREETKFYCRRQLATRHIKFYDLYVLHLRIMMV